MSTEEEKAWIAAWRRAGPELERIRREELRRLDDATGTRQATWLGVIDPPAPRPISGLIEFQAWMRKWKAQLEETNEADDREDAGS